MKITRRRCLGLMGASALAAPLRAATEAGWQGGYPTVRGAGAGPGPLTPPGLYEPEPRFVGPTRAAATSADYMAFLAPSIAYGVAFDGPQYEFAYAVPLIAEVRRTGAHAATLKRKCYNYVDWLHEYAARGAQLFVPHEVSLMHVAFNELRARGHVTAQDEAWLRQTTLFMINETQTTGGSTPDNPRQLIRGTFHRAMGQLAGYRIAAAAYPDHADAQMWNEHSERIWADWFTERDLAMNDTNYFYSALSALLYGLIVQPRDEAFTDPLVQSRLWERLLFEMTSDGVLPVVSVSGSRNSMAGIRILALEMVAAKTGDGRYRWAASRMFRWAENNGGFSPGWEHYRQIAINALAMATLVMDDTVVPRQPSSASKLSMRARVHRYEPASAAIAAVGYPIESGLYNEPVQVPNKLVLRSSWEPGSLFAFIEAFSGHDPLNMTAVYAFERWGSAQTEPLSSKYDHQAENLVNIENLAGLEPMPATAYERSSCTVPVFSDRKLASHALISTTNYMAYPASHEREILFVKDRFIMMRDKTAFSDDVNVNIGPQWNTQNIPARGPNWFDCYWQHFGDAQGTVRVNYNNPRWQTLVYHPAKPGAVLTLPRRVNSRIKAKYHLNGERAAGDALQFGTLLLPHSSTADAAALAAGIEVLHDRPGLLAISIAAGNRWELALLNPEGAPVPIRAPDRAFTTTAKALYLDYHYGAESDREEWA